MYPPNNSGTFTHLLSYGDIGPCIARLEIKVFDRNLGEGKHALQLSVDAMKNVN